MEYNINSQGSIATCLDNIINKSRSDSPEIVFITSNKPHKFNPLHIIDMTSHSKINKLKNYGYGFEFAPASHPNISNPGCSALGSLYALFPIKDFIKDIQITVYFPLSSMKKTSPNRQKAIKEGQFILKREHYHQQEIENIINQKISYTSIITTNPNIMEIEISLNSSKDISKDLQTFYNAHQQVHINPNQKIEILNTPNIIITTPTPNTLNIKLDNIYASCFNAVSMAYKLLNN